MLWTLKELRDVREGEASTGQSEEDNPKRGIMRRRRAEIRDIWPDSKYRSSDLMRFINRIMMNGKKSVATKIVYAAIENLEKETGQPALEAFQRAVRNVIPQLEVRPRRVGGATYQVPIEVRPERQTTLAHRWIIQSARARKGQPIRRKLSIELLEAYRGTGTAVRKKDETQRMAEANRAFIHYRW